MSRLEQDLLGSCDFVDVLEEAVLVKKPVAVELRDGTTFIDQVTDVTGAGDTVIAAFALSLAAGATFGEAARLANYAAGIVVMKRGTATVSGDELRQAVTVDAE